MLLVGELEGVPPGATAEGIWKVLLPVIADRNPAPDLELSGEEPPETFVGPPDQSEDSTEVKEQPADEPAEHPAVSEALSRGDDAATNREPSAPSGWVTTQQAARALGIQPRTVRWHIEQGNLEATTEGEGVRRTWLVSIDSLHEFRDARQATPAMPRDYHAPREPADIAAAIPGEAIRELADRLVQEAARASEYRVRLEITAQAESTLREELASERRRREQAERERDQLRQELEAAHEARESPVTPSVSPEVVTPSPASGGHPTAQERPFAEVARVERRRFWRRMFGR